MKIKYIILISLIIVELIGAIISKIWYIAPIAALIIILVIISDLGSSNIKKIVTSLTSKSNPKNPDSSYVDYKVFSRVIVILFVATIAMYAHLSYRIDSILLSLSKLSQ